VNSYPNFADVMATVPDHASDVDPSQMSSLSPIKRPIGSAVAEEKTPFPSLRGTHEIQYAPLGAELLFPVRSVPKHKPAVPFAAVAIE
jgi:hypothetical protein